MKLMGMKGYLHWFAWMFKFSTSTTISCAVITGILYVPTRHGAVVNHSDPFTVLLFLYLYGLAVVTFGFAVSAVFAHSKRSDIHGPVSLHLIFLLYNCYISRES